MNFKSFLQGVGLNDGNLFQTFLKFRLQMHWRLLMFQEY